MKKFDLLIKNGYLVDAASQREGRFDIGLAAGKVARVDSEIKPERYLTPGAYRPKSLT